MLPSVLERSPFRANTVKLLYGPSSSTGSSSSPLCLVVFILPKPPSFMFSVVPNTFPIPLYIPPYLNPFIFPPSLSLISLTLTPRCPHTPPLSLPYMGARPILPLSFALSLSLSLFLSPPLLHLFPLSPYLSSHPCFPSVWLEKLLWIIDW